MLTECKNVRTLRRRSKQLTNAAPPEVLPDIKQDGHVFCFAKTPEQVAEKLRQLTTQTGKKHLIVLDNSVNITTVADASSAISAVLALLK